MHDQKIQSKKDERGQFNIISSTSQALCTFWMLKDIKLVKARKKNSWIIWTLECLWLPIVQKAIVANHSIGLLFISLFNMNL